MEALVVDGWEVGNLLGSGHAGEVYMCTKKGKPSAVVKVVDLEKFKTLSKSAALQRMRAEVAIMSELNHRCVVQPFEAHCNNSTFLLIMSYAPGITLDKILLEPDLPGISESRVLRIMRQLLRAVHHMHQRDIIHGDLKLENIVVDSDNEDKLKITDFGFSQHLLYLGTARALGWTECYAPPECHSHPYPIVSKEYDIWSCGVIMCVLLTGKLPLTMDDYKALKDDRPVDIKIKVNCSSAALEVLGAMLQINSEDRMSAEEVLSLPFFCNSSRRLFFMQG